jgi:hypothetical protein
LRRKPEEFEKSYRRDINHDMPYRHDAKSRNANSTSLRHHFIRMTEIVSLADIATVLSDSSEFADKTFEFTGPPPDSSDLELIIKSSVHLIFDPIAPLSCKFLAIEACTVTMTGLNLIGWIVVCQSELMLSNCSFHCQDAELNSGVILGEGASVTAEQTRFESSSIMSFDAGQMTVNSCSLDKSFAYVKDSRAEISRCTFSEGRHGIVILGNSSTAITECTFQKYERHAVLADVPNEHGLIRIDACNFVDCQLSPISIAGYHCDIRGCCISGCTCGVVCSQGAVVGLAHCELTNVADSGIFLKVGSSVTVADSVIDQSGEAGIFVSQSSTADIRNCRIASAGRFGVRTSGASTAKLRDSTMAGCGIAAISCYDHSRVKCSSCKLAGPTAIGVDVFTGGCVKMKNSAIIGMVNTAIWTHHAGYGTFTGMAISEDPNLQTLPLEELLAMDLTATHILQTESKRPVRVCIRGVESAIEECCQASPPEPGMQAGPPVCRLCGRDARYSLFDACAHAIYCAECWKGLDPTPTECELCLQSITKIISPCDWSVEAGTENMCAICHDEPPDSVLVPCGHALCFSCGIQSLKQKSTCPFCREVNVQVRQFPAYE